MPVCGDLSTMSLVELLKWASQAQRTGVLEVEQNMICRRIEFRKGWIGACSTDDPPAQLGQILLSRGKIDELQLREALERQQQRGHQNLGVILVQNGIYHAVLKEKGEASPVLAKEGAEFYAVKEDLETRGFGEGDVDGKVKVITYGDFVDLIMNDYEKTAWL